MNVSYGHKIFFYLVYELLLLCSLVTILDCATDSSGIRTKTAHGKGYYLGLPNMDVCDTISRSKRFLYSPYDWVSTIAKL